MIGLVVQHHLRTCKSGPKSIGWTTAELAAVDAADATADADVAEEDTTAEDAVVPEPDDAAPVSIAGQAVVSVAAGEGFTPREIRDSVCSCRPGHILLLREGNLTLSGSAFPTRPMISGTRMHYCTKASTC